MVISDIDYKTKNNRINKKELVFIWEVTHNITTV